jgi:uncharacterized protein
MESRQSDRGDYTVTTTVLDREASRRLLGRVRFGRVSFVDDRGPSVLPVNCSVWHGDVVFRTEATSPLHALGDGSSVAFEVDHVDGVREAGWSVLVRGVAHRVDDETEVHALEELDLHPWAAGDHDRWIRIRVEEITGRMIERHRTHGSGADPYMPPD